MKKLITPKATYRRRMQVVCIGKCTIFGERNVIQYAAETMTAAILGQFSLLPESSSKKILNGQMMT